MTVRDSTGAPAHAIRVPREIVNADSVYVVSWAVADGTRVDAGAALCDIETSKAVTTVEAEHAGYVRQLAAVGAEVPVGGLLGYLTVAPDTPLPAPPPAEIRTGAVASGGLQMSTKARQKMEALGLDESVFAGRAFVREQDVLEVAARRPAPAPPREDPRGPFRLEPLGPIQRRIARVMEESVAAIPAAALERCIDLEPVRERARRLGTESNGVVTEVDLLVAAVARTCVQFPRFNGFVTAEYQLHLFEQVNVGVAVDVEGDLYVVVVRDAASKPPAAIAKELRGVQYLAARRRLRAEHLVGGTITVTSMLGRGVHHFQPIPYPHQAAIVGLADPEPGSGRAALGLVFDHRVANGSDAARFLSAVSDALSEPEQR